MGVTTFLNVFTNAIYYNPIKDLTCLPFDWDFISNGIEKMCVIAFGFIVKKLNRGQLLWFNIGLVYTNHQPDLSHQHDLIGGAKKFSATH